MANLINRDGITSYLSSFFPDDPVSARHLNTALGKALTKIDGVMVEVTELPNDAPEWLKKKWPEGGPYQRFEPNAALTARVKHVADWIAGAVASGETWMQHTDDQGRPRKLLKLGSLKQAEAEADDAMRQKNQRLAARLVPDAEGEHTVMAMANGYRIVQLTSETALDRESEQMSHCIGEGQYGYDQALYTDKRRFYSLRDSFNNAHVTFEVNPEKNSLIQCKGKGDKPPIARYMPYVKAFIIDRKYKLVEDPKNTGLVEQDGQYYDIGALPQDFHYHSNLLLSGTGVTTLPRGLRVDGYLDLRENNQLTSLPQDLKVSGDLYLTNTSITSLPQNLEVGGSIDLRDTPIASLPKNLRVGKSLYLTNTSIASLPEGLHVGGTLYLGRTLITSLPEDLRVDGSLILTGTPITSLPKNLHVGRNLYLNDTPITSLPQGLKVDGDLDLSGTRITSFPADLQVKGKIIGCDHISTGYAAQVSARRLQSSVSRAG